MNNNFNNFNNMDDIFNQLMGTWVAIAQNVAVILSMGVK